MLGHVVESSAGLMRRFSDDSFFAKHTIEYDAHDEVAETIWTPRAARPGYSCVKQPGSVALKGKMDHHRPLLALPSSMFFKLSNPGRLSHKGI